MADLELSWLYVVPWKNRFVNCHPINANATETFNSMNLDLHDDHHIMIMIMIYS
jgi:hypothetical protein